MSRVPAPWGRPLAQGGAVAVLVLGLDQLTKAVAVAALSGGRVLPALGGVLHFSLVHNAGAAFGLLPLGWVLVLVGALCCLAVPFFLVRRPEVPIGQVALLGLVWGGSAGNLLDRLRTGGVIDFIDLRWWPVFNVADIAITVGFAVLGAQVLFRRAPRAS